MNEQQNILLQLSLNEVNIVLAALFEAPAKVSMGVIAKVQEQARRQLPQKDDTPELPPFLTPAAQADAKEKLEKAIAEAAVTKPMPKPVAKSTRRK